MINDDEESFYNMKFINLNESVLNETIPTSAPSCNLFVSRFDKIIQFNSELSNKITRYLFKSGKLYGVTMKIDGQPMDFLQSSAATTTTNNSVQQVTSSTFNQSLICFECIEKNCDLVANFSTVEKCEMIDGLGENGQLQRIYNRIPSDYLIDLRNFIVECKPGISVVTGVENGIFKCKEFTQYDCEDLFEDGTGGELTGEELVIVIDLPEESYDCETNFSWIDLNRNAIKTNSFTALSAREFVLGFKKDGKEYVACYSGSANSLEEQRFYIYVDKAKFNQKKSELASSQLEIRVKDLTDEITFKENDFAKSVSEDVIHYRVYDRFGCYFEYYFSHDGRANYELDGQQFEDVIRSVYARRSCALEILRRAICGALIAGTEEFAEFAGEYLSMLHIPSTVYDPENSDYEKFYYEAYGGSDPDLFFGTDETSKLEFAFTCGLINGVADEAEGLVDAFPMIALYICDADFRNQFHAALDSLDLTTIQNAIEEDFQGNQYLKAEAAGRYTIAVISLVIPITKMNLAEKSMSIISKVQKMPSKIMTFIRYAKNGGINGLKVVKGNIQKIIFVNALNAEIDFARFTEDGVMVIDESRIISQLPENPTTLFDIGEASYKTADNLPAKTGELKVVKGGDGEVWVLNNSKIIPNSIDEIRHLIRTENNQAFFWSGRYNGDGVKNLAREIAEAKGGTTLEGLLDNLKIEMPDWNVNDPHSIKLWEDVSEEYAKQAKGEVKAVLGNSLRDGNVWETKELPALMDNINVTKISTIDPGTLIETIIFIR